MKAFAFIVLSLIGLGAYLHFKNDVTLKSSVEADSMEEKEVYKRASTSSRLKNTGLQKKMNPENRPYYPHQDSSPLPNHDNENFYESPGESYVDDFGSDEGASCPYTDINGQCSQEPVVTETDGEEPVEGAPPQSGGEYYKYLNEQTFDSLRAPASEDEY